MKILKKMFKKIGVLSFLIITLLLCSCDQPTTKTTYQVLFDLNGGTLISGSVEQNIETIDELVYPKVEKEGYTFIGWDKVFTEISKDEKLVAVWEKIIVSFKVTFYDETGNILKTEEVIEGQNATAPDAPLKEGYVFTGWDQNFSNVQASLDVKPLYQKVEKYYTVKFLDLDGNIIKEVKVPEGYDAPAPEAIKITGYQFIGWDQQLENVTADLEVKPLYEILTYTVTFKSNGVKISEQIINYGESATAPALDDIDGYVFMGWDKTFNSVKKNLNVNAKWRIKGKVNVYLDLGEGIFTSKDALFKSFFSDFYDFIETNYGLDELKSHNINSLDDFYKLASSMTWKENDQTTHTQMRGIGNIAAKYFLQKDIGGFITSQPTTHFVGYCYQNDMYVDFLLFQIDFFAWWREDEGYTTPTNNGSDFFAESWAPLVDLGKFFYYNENTSYVKSQRVRDCFINIASVVRCQDMFFLDTYDTNYILPTSLKRRGYTFLGWYDEDDNKVIMINNQTLQERRVTYYAKWEKSRSN